MYMCVQLDHSDTLKGVLYLCVVYVHVCHFTSHTIYVHVPHNTIPQALHIRKSCKSFSRSLRSDEAASRPWEMTYN